MRRTTRFPSARFLGLPTSLVGMLLLVAACGAAPTEESDEPDRTLFMFVQEGTGGSVSDNGDGTMTLTVEDPVPYTFYFSDRPETIAGSAPMDEFVDSFSWGSFDEDGTPPPNAALTFVHPDTGDQEVVIVQVTDPVYDAPGGTITYQLKILTEYDYVKEGSDIEGHLDSAVTDIPETFGEVSLFIDDCPKVTAYCFGGYQMNAGRSCRETCGSVGTVPGCWSWFTFSCNPCSPEKVLDECTAPGGYCTKEGSADPLCWNTHACSTTRQCI